MSANDLSRAVEALSHEFALACTEAGVVTWCDDRARRALSIEPGASLPGIAAPGTHAKLSALMSQALAGRIADWEVALVVHERPVTVVFGGAPTEGGMLLVGHVAPENYLRALDQLSESMTEVMRLNREVVTARKELQSRHDELVRLHGELGEAHQGVLAMHAELADRAAELGRVVQVKSRIVADVGHELRTPLHAILVLVRLLLDGVDGPLAGEQSRQVKFIRKSAEDLLQLVDDLLDLSEAEFGKSILRIEPFPLQEFATSTRGMLRPLVPPDGPVALVFEPFPALELETDRTKLGQIVRNLVSNALKFTERGEVRVRFAQAADEHLEIQVSDTGIGIAPADQERVFEEFAHLNTPPHIHAKGWGLGLALSRRLARRLSGDIHVQSEPGHGSSFTLSIPLRHPEAQQVQALVENGRKHASQPAILVVEDDHDMLLEYARHFLVGGLHLVPARSVEAARSAIAERAPAAIVLDIMLDGEASWALLAELKSNPRTRGIPVFVVTVTNSEQKARSLGADEFWVKPLEMGRLVERLKARAPAPEAAPV